MSQWEACECGRPEALHTHHQPDGPILCPYDWTAYACWEERQAFGWDDPPPVRRAYKPRKEGVL